MIFKYSTCLTFVLLVSGLTLASEITVRPVVRQKSIKNSIIIMTPNIWQCDVNSEQTIYVDFLKNNATTKVDLTFTIVHETKPEIKHKLSESLVKFEQKVIRFKIPESFESGEYSIEVSASGDNGYTLKDTLKSINCRDISNGIYIITDKSTYRDSEIVKMKIINIDSSLKPVSDVEATIYITDPNQNRIKQFVDVPFENGLIDSLEFKLSDRSIYGDWSIKVVVEKLEKQIFFTVKEYVLPRFDFVFEVPSHILRSSKLAEGTVEAKYTYGQPLVGSVTVRIINNYYVYTPDKYTPPIELTSRESTFQLTNGKANFRIPFNSSDEFYFHRLNVTVTEFYSKETSSKEIVLNLANLEYQMNLNSYNFVPNEDNEFELSLTYNDGKPYANKAVIMEITQKINYTTDLDTEKRVDLKTDINGKVKVPKKVDNVSSIALKMWPKHDDKQVAYGSLYKKSDYIVYENDDISRLDIEWDEPENKLNKSLSLRIKKVEINANNETSCYLARYLVISRLQILATNTKEICTDITVDVDLNVPFAPSVTFLIYYVHPYNNNITAKSHEINIDEYFANNLEISFDRNLTEPGSRVEINLKSKANSLVLLSVVDKSVELLKKPNGVLKDDIDSQLFGLRLRALYQPFWIRDENGTGFKLLIKSPGLRELNQAGLIVSSDFRNLKVSYEDSKYVPLNSEVFAMEDTMVRRKNGKSSEKEAIRSNFKETWLWKTLKMGNNGSLTIAENIPDTITSWVASGYSLNNKFGFAIANKNEITTFKKFFVSMPLPASLKRGEILLLKIVVYNYNDRDIENVTVTLVNTKNFDLVSYDATAGDHHSEKLAKRSIDKASVDVFNNTKTNATSTTTKNPLETFLIDEKTRDKVKQPDQKKSDEKAAEQKVNNKANYKFETILKDIVEIIPLIRKQSSQEVEILIAPNKIGNLPLTVKAYSSQLMAFDGERRKLKVKAEGIAETQTQALLIDLRQGSSLDQKSFRPNLPANRVPDSEFCSIQIIGDLLGPSLNNLNRLINKPYGCGEQNMITLVPNIFALKYLQAASVSESKIKNIESIKASALDNIQFGYQNQLRYRRNDGSFSAFGESDKKGSSWLTSFVVKAFSQADKFIKIDRDVISKAVDFLIAQQNINGSFAEPGSVIHKAMQGGVESVPSITAYITSALIESQINDDKVKASINKAVSYLQREFEKLSDVYALGLATYALTLAKSDIRKDYLSKFQSKAVTGKGGYLYWPINANEESSSDIELTSYGLLLNLMKNDVSTSLSIVKYLISKSNSLGAYSDTQNTVLALQALSQFGIQVIKADVAANSTLYDLELSVSLDNATAAGQASAKIFNIDDDNSLVLHTWDLPSCNVKVNLNATGNGTALFQLVTAYNMPNSTEVKNMFNLEQRAVHCNSNIVKVRTCATYDKTASASKQHSTGMILIEASLFSGHEIDKLELQKLVDSKEIEFLKLIESDEEKVAFYLDKLEHSSEICVEWRMYKSKDVDNLKPIEVKISDYYQSNLMQRVLFELPKDCASDE